MADAQSLLESGMNEPHSRADLASSAECSIPRAHEHPKFSRSPALVDRAVEFLMCFADQSTARSAAVSFLKRRPDLVRGYRRDFERYAERGLDSEHPSGYAKQLAFASHAYKPDDLTAEGGA